jgi:Ca2+-binding RTX toxin-like protein
LCASSDNTHDNQIGGGKGNDTIFGGDGDDIIDGEDGSDTIDCGPGVDICLDSEENCMEATSCEM